MPDDAPFQRYRGRDGEVVMARQRSEAFTTNLRSGRLDQRKAGSQRAIDLRYLTNGKAGDYEVIRDLRPQHGAARRHGTQVL